MTPILDACCGSRMFWYDKKNPNVTYMDIRTLHATLSDGRKLIIEPDVIGDFRHMPFPDNSFYQVIFDPPHLIHAGENSWLSQKYGLLDPITWKSDLQRGFAECMRVLKPYGTLAFKWNTEQISAKDVLDLFDQKPDFGDKRSKTRWIFFMKGI